MANQELQVWSKNLVQDPISNSQQRRPITDEEFLEGWGRLFGVSAQQMNQMFYLLSSYAPPSDICPYPYPSSKALTTEMLHMNGQSINSTDTPELFNAYGAALPDMTADNLTGFVWVVRKH